MCTDMVYFNHSKGKAAENAEDTAFEKISAGNLPMIKVTNKNEKVLKRRT